MVLARVADDVEVIEPVVKIYAVRFEINPVTTERSDVAKFVVVADVIVALVAVRLVVCVFDVLARVATRFVTNSFVPVALVYVSDERLVNEDTLSVLAERPPAKVLVPCPLPTVNAPAKVEVAVDVAMRLPRRVRP